MGYTWRQCRSVELGRVVVGLGAHCGSAFSANVVVLVAARENEQEFRPRRRCATAPRAEQAGRLKLAEALGPGHFLDFTYAGENTTNANGALDVESQFWSSQESVDTLFARFVSRFELLRADAAQMTVAT